MEQQGFLTANNDINAVNFNFGKDFFQGKIYNAGLYLRFSKDDGQTVDSSSIESQEMILQRYCQDNGYKIYDTYKDDGYTGLNFDRPDFQRMLNDIDDGKVNMVITKDLSRLGRDYIQTGYYSEVYFPDRKIRYIAINDNFDSLKSDNDIAPFKNILNNMYSRDLSRKVKSSLRQRLKNGLYCFGRVPYGYKRKPDNKNKLVIDVEVVEIVRGIFESALNGKGANTIAKALSGRQILIPLAYKARHGNTRHVVSEKSRFKWDALTIRKILQNRVYAGATVGGKCENVNTRTGKRQRNPRDKHIVVENTHEPIVSREDFDRIQQLMTARYKPSWRNEENLFRSILRCGHCGTKLHLNVHAKSNKAIYRCSRHYENPQDCPQNNQIYYNVLKERIWESVRKTINLLQSDNKTVDALKKKLDGQNNSDKQTAEKAKIEKRLQTLTALVRKLYEDYIVEKLDESVYNELLAGYQSEKKTLTARLAIISAELGKTNNIEESINQLRLLAAIYADCTELTSEIVHKFIERIELKRAQIIDGKEVRELNIVYRFINTTI